MKVIPYRKFSQHYSDIFTQNILAFNKAALLQDKNNTEKYSMFYPQFGAKENTENTFLVYGQAVLNWQEEFLIKDGEKTIIDKVAKSIVYSNDYFVAAGHNPLDWVNVFWNKASYAEYSEIPALTTYYKPMAYKANKSFFWNVVYKLVCDHSLNADRNNPKWTEKVIWSNLYKITGDRRNPTNDECLWQEALSVELVKKEIEEIKPAYCIVLTNDAWWEHFRKCLGTKKQEINSIIQSVETFNETKIIVTSRPFMGSSDRHVEEILKVIKNEI